MKICRLLLIVLLFTLLKLPAASPPAISAIKIGGRAAGGTFGWECARCFGSLYRPSRWHGGERL